MQFLFAPATKLMNNLRYFGKFAVLASTTLLLLAVLLGSLFVDLYHDIQVAKHELEGVQILKPMNRLAQNMQQHRGLSSGVLNGNETMRDRRAAKEKEVIATLQETDAALTPTLRQQPLWQAIRSEWSAIQTQGLSWTAPENIKRHTQMIDKVLTFMVEVADETELTLDPANDTYYMMDAVVSKMPAMLEPLGITRARGTGILTRKELSPQMRIDMLTTMANMSATLKAQNLDLEKAWRYDPTLQPVLEPAARKFNDDVEKVLSLIREDILSERFDTNPQDYFALTTKVIDSGYATMFDILIPQLEKQLEKRANHDTTVLLIDMGLALLCAGLTVYLSTGMYYSVMSSVAVFSEGARRLSSGDLTVKFALEGKDELHDAGRDFNHMAATFRDLLGTLKKDIQLLRQSAEHLAASSSQIYSSTSHQSDSASSMAAAIEQMTVGVDHIAKNAQDAQTFSRESDEVAATGANKVSAVVADIQFVAQTVNESATAVEALGRQSDQISHIVGTIKEIADQTNLLALNAAIEAARAGESGRGFAVVADEVRKLAERTAKSTQEIEETISSIQSGTSVAVASMKEGVERVQVGVIQAEEAGQTIMQIQEKSQRVVQSVEDISAALREQATASTQIAQNVEQIAQMAEQNNSAAQTNTNTADELRRLAESLDNDVHKFKT